jgi:hypothetical protein
MDQFIVKHADKLQGTFSYFDRVLFRGYLPFFSGYAMARFLETRGVYRRDREAVRVDSGVSAQGPRAAAGGARGPALRARSPLLAPVPVTPAPSHARWSHAGARRHRLVDRGREAQWRPRQLRAAPLKEIAAWTAEYRRFWDESFDRLEDYLDELQARPKRNRRRKEQGHDIGKRK